MSDSEAKAASPPEFVILTGLSGAGKGTVLRVFEDIGFYTVDNLPVALIPKFIELTKTSSEIQRVALVVDVRERSSLAELPRLVSDVREEAETLLLFLEASDQTLVRRFSETRRPHPLGAQAGGVPEGIAAERIRLAPIRDLADDVIDTSKYNIHDLRRLILDRYAGEQTPALLVTVESFGFKHGVPEDADLLFDVRFLPNPHYLPGGKHLTGHDSKVIEYIRSFPQTAEFIDRVSDLLVYLLPHYANEGKSYLSIGIGCTGGRHRSVFISEEISRRIEVAGHPVKLTHRDLHRQPT